MIERYLIRYFLAVIEHGNFTRAAESCNVTQPTLSVGIKRLEADLKMPLFRRSNRRVDLTAQGARFAEHARRIEAQFNLAEQALQGDGNEPVLRLGILNTIPTRIIGLIAAELTDTGRMKIELVEGRASEVQDRLASARIDMALTLDPGERLRGGFEAMAAESYGLALPADHPLAGRSVITADELADNVMIVRRHCEMLAATSRHFTAHGVRPFFAARSRNDDRVLAYVASGLGVTVMPNCFTAPGVVRVPLAGFNHSRILGVATSKHAPDMVRPIETIRRILAEQIGG